jgi:hypothetical protein
LKKYCICFFRTKENNNSINDDDSISSSQRSDGYSTPSSASMSMDETDENFLPDLYDFEEALNDNKDIEPKFEPFVDVDVADSMDTIVNNVDSRSAMACD